MRRSKTIAGLLAAAATSLTMGAGVASAGTPAEGSPPVEPRTITIMGKCGDGFNPTVPGGAAAWKITCANGVLRVQGWVKDTRKDGKAAELFGTWGDGKSFKRVRAGGAGTVKRFDRARNAATVNREVKIYLRVI